MKRIARVLVIMAGLTLASVSHASMPLPYPNIERSDTPVDRNAAWFQECQRVRAADSPVPSPALPASCRAFEYYDRLDQAAVSEADWGSVRACAEQGRERGVLAMLFANGLGVARNLDVATEYACRDRSTRMEVQLRVEQLMALRQAPAGTRYDHCAFDASGDVMGCHAIVTRRRADTLAGAYFADWRRALPDQQMDAFDLVLTASRAFIGARQGEINHFSPGTESEADHMVRAHCLAFETGKFNAEAPEALPIADTDPEQRLWLAYRDAWVRLGALRYPNVPADTLQAFLAQWRARQLVQR